MIGKYPHTETIKLLRRERAEAVQAASAGLSPQQRLAKLNAGAFAAVRERALLKKKMEVGAVSKAEARRVAAQTKSHTSPA